MIVWSSQHDPVDVVVTPWSPPYDQIDIVAWSPRQDHSCMSIMTRSRQYGRDDIVVITWSQWHDRIYTGLCIPHHILDPAYLDHCSSSHSAESPYDYCPITSSKNQAIVYHHPFGSIVLQTFFDHFTTSARCADLVMADRFTHVNLMITCDPIADRPADRDPITDRSFLEWLVMSSRNKWS